MAEAAYKDAMKAAHSYLEGVNTGFPSTTADDRQLYYDAREKLREYTEHEGMRLDSWANTIAYARMSPEKQQNLLGFYKTMVDHVCPMASARVDGHPPFPDVIFDMRGVEMVHRKDPPASEAWTRVVAACMGNNEDGAMFVSMVENAIKQSQRPGDFYGGYVDRPMSRRHGRLSQAFALLFECTGVHLTASSGTLQLNKSKPNDAFLVFAGASILHPREQNTNLSSRDATVAAREYALACTAAGDTFGWRRWCNTGMQALSELHTTHLHAKTGISVTLTANLVAYTDDADSDALDHYDRHQLAAHAARTFCTSHAAFLGTALRDLFSSQVAPDVRALLADAEIVRHVCGRIADAHAGTAGNSRLMNAMCQLCRGCWPDPDGTVLESCEFAASDGQHKAFEGVAPLLDAQTLTNKTAYARGVAATKVHDAFINAGMPTSLMFACLRRDTNRTSASAAAGLLAGAWSLIDPDHSNKRPARDNARKITDQLFATTVDGNHDFCFACVYTACTRKSLKVAFASNELDELSHVLKNPEDHREGAQFSLVKEACELATRPGSAPGAGLLTTQYDDFLENVEAHVPEKNNPDRVWFRTLVAPLFPRTVARKMIALYCKQPPPT